MGVLKNDVIAVGKRVGGVEWKPLMMFAKFLWNWGVVSGWHGVADILELVVLVNCAQAVS